MKFVYDFRKPEVAMSFYRLYLRTGYRMLYLYGLLVLFTGIIIFAIGWNQGLGVKILVSVFAAVAFLFASFCIIIPPITYKKTAMRLSKKARPVMVDFAEKEIIFCDDEEKTNLFSIPYDLLMDIVLNKDWLILIMKPAYKDLGRLQEKYGLPFITDYRFPVSVAKLTIQEIEEMLGVARSGIR